MVNNSFSPPNILIVDDVNSNLTILTDIIHTSGYIARPVTSARQAVSAIEVVLPDLILMDISMPEIDGYVFCSMLKKSAKTRDIPVIFISVLNTEQDRMKGYQAGAIDFIVKPFEAEELILRINTHLKMYKTQQELEIYNKKLNKIINDQIRKIYEEQKNLLYGLAKLISKRQPGKPEHMERIGKNSRILTLGLQLSPQYRNLITNSFVDTIEIAAPLHDIGKIAISDNELLKQSELNEENSEIGNTHTLIGAEILEDIYSLKGNNEMLKMAIDIVKYHHEYWNGTGYPTGLSGTDIPLSARIVGVINAYDTLYQDIELREDLKHERCVELINEGTGCLYDPVIVSVFNKIQNQLVR